MWQAQSTLALLCLGLTFGAAAHAEPPATASDGERAAASSLEQTPQSLGEEAKTMSCSSDQLESYARRRAFTLGLMAERERRKFESEVELEMRRLEFTQRLQRERARLRVDEAQEFEAEVDDYARRLEFTDQLQAEHDRREIQAFLLSVALEEKKRRFTEQLVATRSHGQGESPSTDAAKAPPAKSF